METVQAISRRPAVRAALRGYADNPEAVLRRIEQIQQIAAPTFAEEARARLVEREMVRLGLADVRRDELSNVFGRLPGTSGRCEKSLVVSAHLDTVFPMETDLTLTRSNDVIWGPGVGDNSTGVAGLLAIAESIVDHNIPHRADIWFVANVCEEGLGDLKGMRAIVDHFGDGARYLVVEGGFFGQLSYQGIGVRRYRIEVRAPGGHSWGNFGVASAIHALAQLITEIDALPLPTAPKTTFNVGVIEGGTSVNTIAQDASILLDLRSEDPAALATLVGQVQDLVERQNKHHAAQVTGVTIQLTQVGDRPAGQGNPESLLVQWTRAALREVGWADIRMTASSTDANVPLSRGYEAVCLGLTESGNCHRLDEYINTTCLPAGLGQLLLVTLAAANVCKE